VSLPFVSSWGRVDGLGCRAAFGYGAILFDGLLLVAVAVKAVKQGLRGG
jgi:hypothetical protein